ncbi:MAG: tyrosine--tRNA ligase [Actinobacteria bacterium]|nr:MAG: tyrosine--tRNA ligase [Actinomycetota bacterium]
MEKDLKAQQRAITQRTVEVLPLPELKRKIEKAVKANKPLNVKFGVDPTSPDLHLGHAVPLNKLRQLQDLGHMVTLIIGDFTARIGDPSGKSATRPQLSEGEIRKHAQTYTQQAFKILDKDQTKVVYNSSWLSRLNFNDLIKMAAKFTVARLMERDDFSKRFKENTPIGLHEFLYPVMQAYDSVVIKSDIELGGTDQIFNMLAGRDLQEKDGQEAQVVLTVPLLVGTDGTQKMSKSLGNHVGLTEPPKEMFGKIMSIPDSLMIDYFKLCTRLTDEEITKIEKGLKSGKLHPGEEKRSLAKHIISIYYDRKQADTAEAEFDKVFKEQQVPSDITEVKVSSNKMWVVKLLVETGLASSNGEARRAIQGNSVKLNSKPLDDVNAEIDIKSGDVLQVGKRKFVKIS